MQQHEQPPWGSDVKTGNTFYVKIGLKACVCLLQKYFKTASASNLQEEIQNYMQASSTLNL